MEETSGKARAAVVSDSVEFDARDVILLREIDAVGSVAKASTNLGRSRARDLSRIETLETVFGTLVERHRGGSGGGGSKLTTNAKQLLNRYERLQTALTATAQVPETVLHGTVTNVTGELADVETAVGLVRGLHDGISVGAQVQARVSGDALTIHDSVTDPDPDSTSARNRLRGIISGIERGQTLFTVSIDVEEATFRVLITEESATRLGIEPGSSVRLTWKATATRLTERTFEN